MEEFGSNAVPIISYLCAKIIFNSQVSFKIRKNSVNGRTEAFAVVALTPLKDNITNIGGAFVSIDGVTWSLIWVMNVNDVEILKKASIEFKANVTTRSFTSYLV